MKRFTPLVLFALLIAVVVTPLWAATADKPAATSKAPGAAVAASITTVTGMAISPLLGAGAYGAYQWASAKDETARAALPWYAQWTFFAPALLLVGACAAKDSLGAVLPPGWKKPLDVLETVENKATGLVAAGAIVPFTMDSLSKMIVANAPADTGHALSTGGLAMLHFGTIDLSWLLNILTVPFGIAMFALVWMASHAINVLILLSPWGAIDAALKGARTALLGVLTLTATMNPWMGAALSIVLLIVAYFVAGWAFRLTTFGSIFCWDFFTLRRARFKLKPVENKLFAGGNLPEVPVRTYGRLRKTETGMEFVYRPWLVMPERTAVVANNALHVGKGLFFSSVLTEGGETYFLLPPRYRGHEEALVQVYGLRGVKAAGLRKAWSVLRELFGGAATKTQIA
ncbi:MAG: hypothetical protein KA257_06310 [Opitutaceae bacterium]|nr:hypothetical protein [Opitutaceae bacterium]MBP9912416.1 hypothetical protein [Opitutaceae bacterium]